MFKKVGFIVGAVVVVGILGLLAASAVFAQGPATGDGAAARPHCGLGPGRGGMGQGMGLMGGVVPQAAADALGMTWEEFRDARASGQTLAEIAAARGVSEQQVIDAVIAERKAALDQAVADGRLTQEQADGMLERMKEMVPFMFTNPAGGCSGMRGMGARAQNNSRGTGTGAQNGQRGGWGMHGHSVKSSGNTNASFRMGMGL